MKSGDIYRGLLLTSESSMNLQLSSCVQTTPSGETKKLDAVYLKGKGVRFIVVPDLLKNAPVLKKMKGGGGGGGGGGRRRRE